MSELGEVDPLTRNDVHARDQVCLSVVTLGAERSDHLFLGHTGRKHLADDAFEDDVGGISEDLRSDNTECDAAHGQQDYKQNEWTFRLKVPQEPTCRGSEVHGLLCRLSGTHHVTRAASWTLRPVGDSRGRRGAHAAAPAGSCDSTISA